MPGPTISCEGADSGDLGLCEPELGELFEQDGMCCRLAEGYGALMPSGKGMCVAFFGLTTAPP
jgi:hypothetical protein